MHLNEMVIKYSGKQKWVFQKYIIFPIYAQDVEKCTKTIRDKETYVVTLDLAPIIN